MVKIEIPNYMRKIKLSEARRKRYYHKESQIKSKKYKDREKYKFVKDVLVEVATGEPIVANPKAAGTPKYKVINSQALYNQSLHPITRAKMMHALKTEFCDSLKELDPFVCPIHVTMEFHDEPKVKGADWDLENRAGIYFKAFHDTLTGYKVKGVNTITPLIEDDNVYFVTAYTCRFVPLEEGETRKLVILIDEEKDPRSLKHTK